MENLLSSHLLVHTPSLELSHLILWQSLAHSPVLTWWRAPWRQPSGTPAVLGPCGGTAPWPGTASGPSRCSPLLPPKFCFYLVGFRNTSPDSLVVFFFFIPTQIPKPLLNALSPSLFSSFLLPHLSSIFISSWSECPKMTMSSSPCPQQPEGCKCFLPSRLANVKIINTYN